MSSSTAAQAARPANAGPAPRQEEESTMKKIMGIVQVRALAVIIYGIHRNDLSLR